jgi:sarcosine oxidase delta subunit
MESKEEAAVRLSEIVFDTDDFFDKEKMIEKLDRLILAWGKELVLKKYIDKVPESDDAWLRFLDREIYWKDLKDQWEHYIVGCLNFFVMLRADIKRDFLLEPDNIRGQRLSRWLWRLRPYLTPLSRDVVTKFCLCYSMILERPPIKVRYNEISQRNTD